MSKEYRQQLASLPRDAVMISGSQTIAVTYWKAIGAGDWKQSVPVAVGRETISCPY